MPSSLYASWYLSNHPEAATVGVMIFWTVQVLAPFVFAFGWMLFDRLKRK